MATTWFWDFIGPRSEAIARHHVEHLSEFIAREKLEGFETGVTQQTAMKWSAWLRGPGEQGASIEKALRPPRKEQA